MTNEFAIAISKQIGAVEKTADAAHDRIDRFEDQVMATIQNLTQEVKELNAHMARTEKDSEKVEELTSEMNKMKGAKAALIVISSLVGGLITFLVNTFLK